MSDGKVFTAWDSCVGESVVEYLDDLAIVILLTDNTSIHQCLALPTVPTLPGIMPLQQGMKETYDALGGTPAISKSNLLAWLDTMFCGPTTIAEKYRVFSSVAITESMFCK